MSRVFVLIAIVALGTACGHSDADRFGSLKDAIQAGIDSTVARFSSQFPDLALSVAWKDASLDISLASGNVSGRALTPQDTFLYGSGTKPITAAAILRLIDQGKIKGSDKVSSIVDPYLKARGKPPLADIFGEEINDATVLQLIRMNAGLRDFEDSYELDSQVLADGYQYWNIPFDAMNFSVSQKNIQAGLQYKGVGNGSLYCKPGSCTAYSSTSFIVAGLVLVAELQPNSEWYDFDLGAAVFEDRTVYPSMSFPPNGPTNGAYPSLSEYLTTPGSSVSSTWPKATIYNQSTSILGFTCGNMVASPHDVAKFYYHLLDSDVAHADPKPLISDQARAEMTHFQELSRGWCRNDMEYGAGMMQIEYGKETKEDPHGILVIGHEGDTYGFVSSQGYVPSLKGAYSVVANVDHSAPMEHLTGQVLKIAKRWMAQHSEPKMLIV